MDPSAPWAIAMGGLTTSLCGTGIGAAYGTFSSQPWLSLMWRSTVNSGLVGWTFFAFREILVSPLLVTTLPWKEYERRRILFASSATNITSAAVEDVEHSHSTTWRSLRTRYILDSCLAGGLTGGVLNGIKRGSRGVAPGMVAASLLCSILQYAANEATVQRLKFIGRKEVKQSIAVQLSTSERDPESSGLQATIARWTSPLEPFLKGIIPRKLTEEEYAARVAAREQALKEKGKLPKS